MGNELNINAELKAQTTEFFSKNNIQLPIEVQNAISDVFDENDFNDDDSVNIYFKEDLDSFQSDTMLLKQLNVQVRGGNSSGDILDKYSYYGVLTTEGAYSENIALYDGEEMINQLSYIEPTEINKVENPDDYCVVVIEESEFHMGEYNVIPRLYIYVPKNGEGIE